MNPRLKRRLIAAGIIILLVSLPCIWFARQHRQVKLDRALIVAINRNDADAVDMLLVNGANPNARETPQKPQTPMQIIKELIHPSPPGLTKTALMIAAYSSPVRIVTALLRAGADVNVRDKYGETALFMAAANGHASNVKALIAAGADVNHRAIHGGTVLVYAGMVGNTDTLTALIEAGADVNAKEDGGSTPLIDAAQWGNCRSCKAFIAAGADVNGKDHSGWTALKYAIKRKNSEMASMLRAAGAKE